MSNRGSALAVLRHHARQKAFCCSEVERVPGKIPCLCLQSGTAGVRPSQTEWETWEAASSKLCTDWNCKNAEAKSPSNNILTTQSGRMRLQHVAFHLTPIVHFILSRRLFSRRACKVEADLKRPKAFSKFPLLQVENKSQLDEEVAHTWVIAAGGGDRLRPRSPSLVGHRQWTATRGRKSHMRAVTNTEHGLPPPTPAPSKF